MNRRTLLQTLGATAAGTLVAGCAGSDGETTQNASSDAANESGTSTATPEATETATATPTQTVTTSTLREGTAEATDLYVIDAPKAGPTFFLVGGVHGDEVSGWKTATAATEWDIDAGTLVVLPKANIQGVENRSREYPEGTDLNRQFERGKPPKNELATAIWDAIVEHDPDVLVDLHSSKGFQADDTGYVGQNVFHSQQGTMGPDAEQATAFLNENYVPASRKPKYEFVTTTMSKNLAMIADKARADLEIPTAIFEVTEADLPEETRIEWTTAYTRWMLDHWGVRAMEGEQTAQSTSATNTTSTANATSATKTTETNS
ncbi:M14 family metallopeptidase [Halogranum rubrum]|uniref:Succinylglutamate desuccinylase/Aspartoacylase catalytic domain-containing protein n=1 Tax=Halogranum salarium B-1 TaxID=1210908 RepID=J3F0I3_9EURY|nr:M14 family metallopeptidase [Halogranum salarium]EJN61607.1 hypothetical protein HSB1_06480 [Halogranum salarium B-1]